MSNDRTKGRKASGFYLARASRVVLACILVAVAIWPVGVQPQTTQAAPVYVPQTPTPTEPEQPTIVPGTLEVESGVENAVRQALAHALDILPASDCYAISGLREADSWLFVSVVGLKGLSADLSWNLLENATWFGLVLLHQDRDGRWTGAVEGTVGFSSLLADVPEDILSTTAKQDLDPLQHRLVAAASTYRFPWQSGTSMQYGQRGIHDAGFFSGWKAVDFLSDGNTSAGYAPNRLLAAAGGAIGYVCKDGTSVTIRIGDLLYAHLLDNGNLYTGHYFNQGNEMGQMKPGSFSGNCGWAQQSPGWFHVHWGFPNTGSFEAGGWTLNLSDHRWRRGSETRYINDWFQADDGGTSCSAPSLIEPANEETLRSRTITFRWNPVSGCAFDGYTFRVCTSPDFDNLNNCFIDTGEGSTQRTETINDRDKQDLYWGVRAANAPSGADWAVRHFRIDLEKPRIGDWEAKYFNTRTCWDDHSQCNNPQYSEPLPILSGSTLLDKNWYAGSPGGSVGSDDWTGYFKTTIDFPAGDYVFYADHDDGLKLKIGNYGEHTKGGSGSDSKICNNGQGGYALSGRVPLEVYLREDGGDAKVKLWYSTDTSVCPMRLNFTTGLGHQAEVEIVVTSVGDPDDQLSQNNVTTDSQGNGSVELSGCVEPGRYYDIYAKPYLYLRQEKSMTLQPGTNSVTFDAPFEKGDIIDDNSINVMDLLYVLQYWGSSDPEADLSGDGTINILDILILLGNWGTGAGWTDSRTLKCGTAAISAKDAISTKDANGGITLTPDAGPFNVGDTFDMQVLLDTGGHETDGVDLIVLYDPGVLAVQDTDPITGTQISAGSIYTNTQANTVIPSLGEIRYSADVDQDGIPFQGSGTLATITFTVTAAISNTAVKVYYQDGWTGESNIVESETITDVLGYANIASFQTIGSPSRPMPSVSFTPASNAFVNISLIELEAEATDPYNQVKEVEFEANLSGVWTTIGSDTFGPYWRYRWDASSVPDGVYDLRASALLLGGEGTTVTNSSIMLDRTLPTYISSTITLLDEPYVGVPVAIEVTADDEGSGVDHIDVYARKVYDSAVYGAWNFIGPIPGSQGSLVWDTSGYSAGTYQIAFSIQDQAGNWGPDSQPELLLGLKGKVFLPVILKNSDGTAPPVETLNFKVSFQGRDNAASQLQNVPIKVKIKSQSGDQTLFESGWVSVIPAGSGNNWGTALVNVSSAALTPGQAYQVFVKGAMHLAKRITTSLMNGQTIDYTDPTLNPDGFLRAGDIDQDNQVGTADLTILLSHWGQAPPTNPDPSSEIYRSDLNGDGTIGTFDQLILLDSWGTGDPY